MSSALNKAQKLKFYKDPECTKEVVNIRFPEAVEVGKEVAEIALYAKNITREEFLVELQFVPEDPDLTIEKSSDKCKPQETIIVKFIFAPKENREKPLNTNFVVKGRAIIEG